MTGGGRVDDDDVVRLASRARRGTCASSQILPIVSISRRPGVAAATMPKVVLEPIRSASIRNGSWSCRYSSSAWCGSTSSVQIPGASSLSTPDGALLPNSLGTSPRPLTSTTIARRPWRAASSPSAAASVERPTPPLPSRNTSSTIQQPAAGLVGSVRGWLGRGSQPSGPPRNVRPEPAGSWILPGRVLRGGKPCARHGDPGLPAPCVRAGRHQDLATSCGSDRTFPDGPQAHTSACMKDSCQRLRITPRVGLLLDAGAIP